MEGAVGGEEKMEETLEFSIVGNAVQLTGVRKDYFLFC